MKNKPTNLHLSDKLDVIDARLDDVEKILVLQEANLKEHMRRTDILENALTTLLKEEIKPLNKFRYGALGIVAFLTILGTVVGIYSALK